MKTKTLKTQKIANRYVLSYDDSSANANDVEKLANRLQKKLKRNKDFVVPLPIGWSLNRI